MRRRILVSYLALAVVVLVALEVPLGVLVSRRERDALRAEARRDATSLAVLAAEEIEHPSGHDLDRLAARYRQETGAEVAIVDRAGGPLVSLSPVEREGTTDLVDETSAARGGRVVVGGRQDEGHPVQSAAVPVSGSDGGVVGAVLVSIRAGAADHRVRLFVVGLVALAVVVLAAVVVGSRLARSVTRPLVELESVARQLGDGSLTSRAHDAGPPELRSMAEVFNRMADRLEEMVRSQREFVADASHQLRSPLTALRLRLETVNFDDRSIAEQRLNQAGDEVARLSRLVDGLLVLASAEHGNSSPQPIDAARVVRERAGTWAAFAEERGVRLIVTGADHVVMVAGVTGHLEQILDNLLANAIEVSPKEASVDITVRTNEDTIEVWVDDHGPGLDDEQRRSAFDRFWQGDRATGKSGLGLAISRQLARAGGGDLTLETGASGGLRARLMLSITPRLGAKDR